MEKWGMCLIRGDRDVWNCFSGVVGGGGGLGECGVWCVSMSTERVMWIEDIGYMRDVGSGFVGEGMFYKEEGWVGGIVDEV